MRGSKSDVGQTRTAQNGYHYTKCEEGWRLTHHLVAEEKLGRTLFPHERVVFADGDRTNLDEENVVVRRRSTSSLQRKLEQNTNRIAELESENVQLREKIRKIEAGEIG